MASLKIHGTGFGAYREVGMFPDSSSLAKMNHCSPKHGYRKFHIGKIPIFALFLKDSF